MIKCKNKACGERFTPLRPLQAACSTGCAISLGRYKTLAAKEKAAKLERKETKAKIQALKGLSYWEGRAQHEVNKFIRIRDHGDPCISCDITYSTVWQAGHFKSVGAHPNLRYNDDNIHLQCVQCNHNLSGNVGPYRVRLIVKIGLERVEALEVWHPAVKSTVEQCQAIEAVYKAKTKKLVVQSDTYLTRA